MGSKARLLGLLVVVSFCGSVSCQEQPVEPEESVEPGVWEEVERIYEKAKETGEHIPKDIYEWIRRDIENLGDWEYRVVEIVGDANTLELKLNELGRERWECIWIEPSAQKTRFFLKRPVRSYLKTLPLSQLLKLIPTGGGD